MSTEFRLGLTLRPDMNLDVYAEPFAASGRYYDFGELLLPATRDRITYGTTPGTTHDAAPRRHTLRDRSAESTFTLRQRDFNTLSFRSNVVLRWEWRPGSTLYLVWQQDRSGTEVLGTPRRRRRHVPIAHGPRQQLLRGQDVFLVEPVVSAFRRTSVKSG